MRPVHVRLEVSLEPTSPVVRGRVTHTVRALRDGVTTIPLDAADMTIEAAERDGERLAFTPHATGVDVALPRPLAADDEVTFSLTFEARPTLGLYFVGPDARHPDRRPQIWTQGAMEDHHHWFPCFDGPQHLVTSEVIARVPEGFVALSNGVPVTRDEPAGKGWRRFHWRHETPHAPYLITLVVDRVVEVVDERGPVPLHHYVPAGREADARALFERMPEMMAFFGELTGRPYPYPRYGHVFLQDFMWGGMENTTLTSLTDAVLVPAEHRDQEDVERLYAHELAHQWFGDLIAPRGWAEIWLNESLATYGELLCMGHLNGPDDFARRLQVERDSYLEEARTRYARPVVTRRFAHPYVLFDRHAYEKGCLVLHTLRDQIGDEAFFRGLRAYVRAHAGRAAETADLRRAFEDAAGEDLTDFFEHLVYGAAHPEVRVRWRFDRHTGLEVEVARTDDGAHTLRVALDVQTGGRTVRRRVRLAPGERTLVLPVDAPPVWVAVDPEQACLLEIDEDAEDDAALRARLDAATAPVPLRMRTARLLGGRGSPVNTAALAAVLATDPSEPVRIEAAGALGEHRAERAYEALLAAVHDPAWRGAAALVETLDALLKAEPRHRVRCGLLVALGGIRTEAARKVVTAHLDEPSTRHSVAVAALTALAAHEEPDTLDTFVDRAEGRRPDEVRVAAVEGLARVAKVLESKEGAPGRARREHARQHLEAWLRDPSFKVRHAAIKALATLGDPAAKPALQRAHGAEVFAILRRRIRETLGALEAEPAKS